MEVGVSSTRSGPLQGPVPMSQGFQPRAWEVGHAPQGAPRWEQAENPQFEYPGREPGKREPEFLAIRRISSPPILTSLLSIGVHPWLGFWGSPWPPQNSSFQPGEPRSFLPAGNGASGGELLPFPAQPQAAPSPAGTARSLPAPYPHPRGGFTHLPEDGVGLSPLLPSPQQS